MKDTAHMNRSMDGFAMLGDSSAVRRFASSCWAHHELTVPHGKVESKKHGCTSCKNTLTPPI